jgi:hypothetical protein
MKFKKSGFRFAGRWAAALALVFVVSTVAHGQTATVKPWRNWHLRSPIPKYAKLYEVFNRLYHHPTAEDYRTLVAMVAADPAYDP